ncbi:hypothetical protein VTI28DRAFT_8164 [Corynascus sepedonium]
MLAMSLVVYVVAPTAYIMKSGGDAWTLYANHLLAAILSADDLTTMRPCSLCESRGIASCEISKTESSRYAECVRSKRSGCDVLDVSPS